MWSKLRHLAAGFCLLALTACTTGMVLGNDAHCTGSTELITQVSGACNRIIEELTEVENESIAVQTSDIAPFATVDWQLTVELGAVTVTFTDFRGNAQTTEVTPTHPGSGSVRVQLDPLNRLNWSITPVGGVATGVDYQLKFICDCLP